MQHCAEEAVKAQARVQEQQNAAREAFQQASAHARSAQQAEARCQVLEQAVQRAERNAEASSHLQQVSASVEVVLHAFCAKVEKKRNEKEKITPFGVNLTRSQVLHQAAQVLPRYILDPAFILPSSCLHPASTCMDLCMNHIMHAAPSRAMQH